MPLTQISITIWLEVNADVPFTTTITFTPLLEFTIWL